GGHTATTTKVLAGPTDVVASTSAVITFGLRGILVPATVTLVIQDLAASGGNYSAPASKSLYFGLHQIPNGGPCTGTVSIAGFAQSNSSTGGILQPTQTVINNTLCVVSLEGYLK